VGAVDHEVVRPGSIVDVGDRPGEGNAAGNCPSVSTVKEIATGRPAARAARTMPIASPVLVKVSAPTMSAPARVKASICGRW
jgi:hypothetical protein